MSNKYFPDEQISFNDLYFVCYMIERVARKIHQRNKYVVEHLGTDGLLHCIYNEVTALVDCFTNLFY